MKKNHLIALCLVLLVSTPAVAALIDHFDTSRVATITVTCPLATATPCFVEVVRVRPLLPAFQTEAETLGMSTEPIPDRTRRFSTTRAQLQTWLGSATPLP
jgi:hypothetical protein